jgi:hypothetical protein
MPSARWQESPLSQDQTIFGRHAGWLLGLVALVGAIALGTLPVSVQAEVPEFRSQANSILRRSPFAELLRQMQDRDASVAPSGQTSP